MPTLGTQLDLDRCPHCGVDRPTLSLAHEVQTRNYQGGKQRFWRVYVCNRCGSLVTAAAERGFDNAVTECYPSVPEVHEAVPQKARAFLAQAHNSLSQPAGAVMLAASAVDAMLKAKGLKDGSLYTRIDKAASDHTITADMAQWPHDVRLDANDQRHAEEEAPLPDAEQARRCVDFADALAQFMFVLPARVQRGLGKAAGGA